MRSVITDDIRTLSHRLGDEAVLKAISLVDASVDAYFFSLRAIVAQGVCAVQGAVWGVFDNLDFAAFFSLALACREE